jgi:hypothetical protein
MPMLPHILILGARRTNGQMAPEEFILPPEERPQQPMHLAKAEAVKKTEM